MSLTPTPKPLVPLSQIHNPLNESLKAHMVHKAHISLSGLCFVQLGWFRSAESISGKFGHPCQC